MYKRLMNLYKFKHEESGGKSPLDIPGRAMISSFLFALLLAYAAGTIILYAIRYAAVTQVEGILPNPREYGPLELDAVIQELLPSQMSSLYRIRKNDRELKSDIRASFTDGISFMSIDRFMSMSADTIPCKTFARYVVGDLSHTWFFFPPVFKEKNEQEILDLFKVPKPRGSDSKVRDPLDDPLQWRRDILISGIALLQGHANRDWIPWRRILQALAGLIQWITFILALWCLVLLAALRLPWAKLQMQFISKGLLPWHSPRDPSIWQLNLPPGQTPLWATLNENFRGSFVVARLIQEVILAKDQESPPKTSEVVKERVATYRNSVDQGEYEIINFLIWAVPTFGFIGTILGIIGAMENSAEIVRASGVLEQAAAIKEVAGHLGTAFDTTLIALTWLVPLTFLLARTRKIEANFFEQLEFEANRHLPDMWDQ